MEISLLRKHRPISIFLIVTLSFILPLASAYLNYNTLIEADFFTQGAKFEAGDLDDLWADKQIDLDFIPSESLLIASPEISLHGLLKTSQVVSINSLFSILRC